jgi:hypothetical protein
MSCFTRISTQITDEETLRQAVPEIGYSVRKRATSVRGWSDHTTQADLVIATDTEYDIGGIKTKDGTFDFVADWEMSRIDKKKFVGELTQAYSCVRVTQAAKKSGFVVVKQKADEKGSLHLVLRKFV